MTTSKRYHSLKTVILNYYVKNHKPNTFSSVKVVPFLISEKSLMFTVSDDVLPVPRWQKSWHVWRSQMWHTLDNKLGRIWLSFGCEFGPNTTWNYSPRLVKMLWPESHPDQCWNQTKTHPQLHNVPRNHPYLSHNSARIPKCQKDERNQIQLLQAIMQFKRWKCGVHTWWNTETNKQKINEIQLLFIDVQKR